MRIFRFSDVSWVVQKNTRMWTIKYQNKNTKIDLSSTIMNRFLKILVFWKAEHVLFHLVITVLWSHASLVRFGGLMDDIWFLDHLFWQIFRYSKSRISLIWSSWPMKFGTKLNMALKNNSKLWMVFSRWWCGLGGPKMVKKKVIQSKFSFLDRIIHGDICIIHILHRCCGWRWA